MGCCESRVPRHCVVQLVEIRERTDRMLDELEPRVRVLLRHARLHGECPALELPPLRDAAPELATVERVATRGPDRETGRVEQLGLAARGEVTVRRDQLRDRRGQ